MDEQPVSLNDDELTALLRLLRQQPWFGETPEKARRLEQKLIKARRAVLAAADNTDPHDAITTKEFAAVLLRAQKAELVGRVFEVSWYDGPLYGLGLDDETLHELALLGGDFEPGAALARRRPRNDG